ncbi:unnamed protein product [Rotaria socialis]|uniref:HAT C-terminal dimerisation domain-containing protein n=2 Tax=Rotaria socialis TaxID=392032 RepID=A0A818CF14_9BILA|nr:unnamed protein product [Rotaria socialis]
MVLLCNLSLKHALSSHQSLLDYVDKHCNSKSNTLHNNEIEENEDYELEGIKWFRERFLILIDELFCLDVRHYCATLLNPKYKLLKFCTKDERTRCHEYIRQQLKILTDAGTTAKSYKTPSEPQQKVFKTADTIFACFEDDYSNDEVQNDLQDSPYESDEYEFNTVQFDELDRYLILNIDKVSLTNNPLDFWRNHTMQFPLLSKLAKRVFSIPATSCGVERQFSSAASFTQAHLLPSLPTAANSPQHLVMNDSTTKTISNDSDSSSQNSPSGIFQCVRKVSLFDERHFEHEFFLQIQKSIPLMQQFIVVNQQRQTNKKFGKANNENGDLATIHYPDLEHLDHLDTCIHYHRQFLLDAKMCLTYHVRVYMNYEIVDIKVTRNFRRNSTRSNCAKMNHVYLFRKLEYHGPFYEFFRPKIQFPEDIKDYFPYAEIK